MNKTKKPRSKRPKFHCQTHGLLELDQVLQLSMPSKVSKGGIPSYGVICKTCEGSVTVRAMNAHCTRCDVGLQINTATWHYDTKKQVWIHNCKLWRSANGTTSKQKTSKNEGSELGNHGGLRPKQGLQESGGKKPKRNTNRKK